jgi:hypothetical protein
MQEQKERAIKYYPMEEGFSQSVPGAAHWRKLLKNLIVMQGYCLLREVTLEQISDLTYK